VGPAHLIGALDVDDGDGWMSALLALRAEITMGDLRGLYLGWLRGTQILTSVVGKHFTQEGAELLHQPDLLKYFGDRLTAMPEYSVPVVESIKRALVEVRPLIDSGSKPISPEAVKKINEITTRLDGEIVTR